MEKDDLSLLSGMTVKERRKYNGKGIFTVTQLSYTFRPRRRSKRKRDKREKYHHALKRLEGCWILAWLEMDGYEPIWHAIHSLADALAGFA